MKLLTQSPKKALKAFLKQKPLRSEIDLFKSNLISLLDKIYVIDKRPKDESEEHLKNDLRDFLRDTYYKDTNAINTKDKKDLVIHLGKTTDSEVGVIIEAKRPANINEMVTADNTNKKALYELILYYLDERNQIENNQLKQLVMTNINEWFIIDANYFDKHIYRNTQIKKLYETKRNDKKDNPFFYEEIAKIISKIDIDIPCVYFDIRDYESILRNTKKEDDKELISLFKILSPQHLLKIATPNDSNSLDEKFYKELLYIIGLEEAKEGGKNIIRRKKENRNGASLIEATIEALITEDTFHRIPDPGIFGSSKEERLFNISLELCITWINRILFLKLLEGQLITYHQGNKDFRFLNSQTIHDFDELFKLFHKVLAVDLKERSEALKEKYQRIPYLNSSLFEISELEDQAIKINSLDNSGQLDLIGTTILKEVKKRTNKLPTLDYLFQFLDAYDFASEGTEEVQEDNKTIINASVLGKVFEKINGYKDGSIFTPGFITMYMCKQSIRLAVVQKFNEALSEKDKLKFDKFEDIKNYTSRLVKTDDILKTNEIINSIRICDPAVGSGHFLVSSLNEIISIKTELGIFADKDGNLISGNEIEIINDELIITDQQGNIFEYKLQNGKPISKDIQRLQKALFYEKQTIIENCLFGVDINPNSVKICRLRLWIELLKNAYYKEESNYLELETLPNIDINIKCGNSLLSRFPLDADLSKALKSIKYNVKAYREFVNEYKNEKNREVKRGLQKIIDTIKSDFRTEIGKNDPKQLKLSKVSGELFNLLNQGQIFELSEKDINAQKAKRLKLETEINKLSKEIEEIKSNAIYKNAFEWRFEFPEVLSNEGEFEGFDVVIGNPPYIRVQELEYQLIDFYKANYKVALKRIDISIMFIELSKNILKSNRFTTLITSNQFLTTEYGAAIRSFLKEEYRLLKIIDFGDLPVFESALTYVSIFLFQKANPIDFQYCRVSDLEEAKSANYKTELIDISKLTNDNWILASKSNIQLIDKLKLLPTLNDFGKSWAGLFTGMDKILMFDNKEIEKYGFENEIILPVIRANDCSKFYCEKPTKYVIYPYKYVNGKTVILNEEELKRQFPVTYKYLVENKNELIKRKDSRKSFHDRESWFSLTRFGQKNIYNQIKIVSPGEVKEHKFCIDESQSGFSCARVFAITIHNKELSLKYLLAILNSSIIKFFIQSRASLKAGGYYSYSSNVLNKIPIKYISEKDQEPFIILVDRILEAKQKEKDSEALEKKIDELVYKLYDITPEEQKIIEGH